MTKYGPDWFQRVPTAAASPGRVNHFAASSAVITSAAAVGRFRVSSVVASINFFLLAPSSARLALEDIRTG